MTDTAIMQNAGGKAGGNHGGEGGGIYNEGDLSLSNDTVSQNHTHNAMGAGIYNAGTLTAVDTIVGGNAVLQCHGPVHGGHASIGAARRSSCGGDGGGIFNSGTLSLTDSTVMHNYAEDGGGIANDATLLLTDSALVNNTAHDLGGAIDNVQGAVTVNASTLSQNTGQLGSGMFNDGTSGFFSSTISGNSGTAIDADAGSLSVAATIVANTASGADCVGPVTDFGYNISDDSSCGFSSTDNSQAPVDPDLGLLQNNGGPTPTEEPGPNSPALEQIPSGTVLGGVTLCPGTDQRGISRPQGTACDIGAVEVVNSNQERSYRRPSESERWVSFSIRTIRRSWPTDGAA
jgi:hypothetical protein